MASRTVPPTTTAPLGGASVATTRSSAVCARGSRARRSSATAEQPRGVVVEDLAPHRVRQRAVPRPPALFLVVVRDQRKVGAEEDTVLIPDERLIGDGRRIG